MNRTKTLLHQTELYFWWVCAVFWIVTVACLSCRDGILIKHKSELSLILVILTQINWVIVVIRLLDAWKASDVDQKKGFCNVFLELLPPYSDEYRSLISIADTVQQNIDNPRGSNYWYCMWDAYLCGGRSLLEYISASLFFYCCAFKRANLNS